MHVGDTGDGRGCLGQDIYIFQDDPLHLNATRETAGATLVVNHDARSARGSTPTSAALPASSASRIAPATASSCVADAWRSTRSSSRNGRRTGASMALIDGTQGGPQSVYAHLLVEVGRVVQRNSLEALRICGELVESGEAPAALLPCGP